MEERGEKLFLAGDLLINLFLARDLLMNWVNGFRGDTGFEGE